MKWVKRIGGIAAGIFIFCMIINWLNYIYVSAFDSGWERILWHNFYEDEGKIDNLYLGSSHVYYDINPFMLDNLNGQYNFNLSSPRQLMNGTYYLLQEADRTNRLSHVYIEVYYLFNTKENFNENKDPILTNDYKNWQNTDYMKISINKMAYMHSIADIAGVEKYVDICIPFSRYRENLDNWEIIESTIADKRTFNYMNYIDYGIDDNGYYEMKEKGFRYSTRVYQDTNRRCAQQRILNEAPMAEISESYLRKAIEYCQKKDIPVTLFASPIYELQLISTENYDNYLDQIKEIAEEYNVAFYDFNLAKEEYLPIQDTKYFWDSSHLNCDGADMYTIFFHEVVSGEEAENKKYFYDSYEQKLKETAPSVYGIYYRNVEKTDDEILRKNVWIASNRDEDMEYRIILTPEEKEQYMVQDFSENKMFTVERTEHGICTIVYRMKDAPEKVQTIEINY